VVVLRDRSSPSALPVRSQLFQIPIDLLLDICIVNVVSLPH
jgi:hypothetical protein